jgi:hypothetical protein
MTEKDKEITDSNDSQIYNASNEFKLSALFIDPNIRLIKVRRNGKEAIERGWQTVSNYGARSQVILEWIRSGGNYGLTCPFGFCCFVDADTKEIQNALDSQLPRTSRWSTGKEGHFQYAYFIEEEPIGCIPLKDGAYIKGKGGYALGPGSVHPNGTVYGSREIRDVPMAIVKKSELLDVLDGFLISKPSEPEAYTFKKLPVGTATIDREEIIRILRPYWARANGKRNDFTLAIAGFIARSGGSEDDAVYVIARLCEMTGKGCDHVAGARYAFRREGPVKGFRSLEQLMEDVSHD